MGKIITSRGLSPTLTSKLLVKFSLQSLSILLLIAACFHHQQLSCDQYLRNNFVTFAQAQQRFVDSSTIKPSLILILPQSFKVPINPSLENITSTDLPKLQQYVAIVNNAQDDQEDDRIRRHYKRLALQIRDARSTLTGQLYFEYQFDYFAPNATKFLLIPINLDQVSVPITTSRASISTSSFNKPIRNSQETPPATYSKPASEDGANLPPPTLVYQPQQLIVSIRPVQEEGESNFGRGSVELVSSAPALVEPVPSSDGRRAFSVVQTDKPIYKPSEKVRIRAMVVNENLRPVIGDELRLQIKNPNKIVVESQMFPRAPSNQSDQIIADNFRPMFIDHVFEFPPEPMLGKWSVHLLHSDQVANDTTNFEVKEYVLPPFDLTLESPKYILPNTHQISGAAIAKYHFGRPVQGKVHFKFGFISPHDNPKTKFLARSSIKNIDPLTGRVEYNISMEKFSNHTWFPAIAESRLVVEATAMDMTTGHRETATDSSCIFMMMPYIISFEESIEDFKPGLTQHLVVKLIERLSLQPGPMGQRIFAEYRDHNKTILGVGGDISRGVFDTEAMTDASGRAIFKVGPVGDDIRFIQVTMKLVEPERVHDVYQTNRILESRWYTGNELAIGNHTLIRHDSSNGWIAIMNKSITHVNVGNLFVTDFLMKDFTLLPQKVFYTIVARGQIVTMGTIDDSGMVSFLITEQMVPSIRLVLFALTPDSVSLVSDSMRINVDQNLDCGLKLAYRSKDGRASKISGTSVRPNTQGYLDITARQGDLVSIMAVDQAVYSLNNRTRLESSRIVDRIRLLDTGCGFGGGKNNLDVFHNAGLMLYKNVASETLGHIGSSCLSNPMKYLEEASMGYPKPMLARLSQDLEAAPHYKVYAPKYLSRPKRDADIEKILKRYKDPAHRACCKLGTFEDVPQKRNCLARMRIVEKYYRRSDPCAGIFHDCCRHAFGETELSLGNMFPVFTSEEHIPQGRSGYNLGSPPAPPNRDARPHDEDATRLLSQIDKIEAETLIRRDFRETWLFDLVGVEGSSGKASLDVQLPHTITSWSISALALNQYMPMCIMARPFKINTFQEIFVQLAMPYKIVQGEQVDLVATLYNYSPQIQDVLVYMYGVDDLCSDAEPGERSEQRRVRIDRHASQAVIFSMIPLKIGQYPIKVVAVTLSSNSSDIIERQLNVVPRGKPVTEVTTFSLDPMNQQRRSKRAIQTGNLVDDIDSTRGLQHSTIHLRPARDSEFIVPETQECIISAIGDKLGHVVQTSLLDVENLIRLPQGCGEQVMIYLGPTLYTVKYLESIDKLTGDLRWRAIRYIQSGYKRILNYRHETGAFSAFPNREPSVWLTAFVAKLLCQTERTEFIADQIHVDKTVVNTALNWLISKQHKKLGTWIETNPVYHREMLGGILKESALSAFVALTFNECAHHSMDIVDEIEAPGSNARPAGESAPVQTNGFEKLNVATEKAEEAILRERHRAVREKNPYVMALIAYALSFNRPHEAASMMNDLMPLAEHYKTKNVKMWRGRYHIETNSYALQAIIQLAPLVSSQPGSSLSSPPIAINWKPGADALSLANFLSSQRSYTGAFDSTQDTVVALEALSKFAQLQSSPNGNALVPQTGDSGAPNLLCNVTISNRTRRSIEFGRENAQILQTFKLDSFELDPVAGENLDIITSGNGLGTMSVKLKYNVFQADDELCRFDIDSSIQEWRPPKLTATINMSREDNKLASGDILSGDELARDEQDLFKTFDQSMLSELNLLDPNRSPNLGSELPEEGASAGRAKRNPKPPPILRLRRYAPDANIQPRAQIAPAPATTESWTSKVVSSLRLKLPDWIAPKVGTIAAAAATGTTTTTTTTTTSQPRLPGQPATLHTTARRSAQSTPPPPPPPNNHKSTVGGANNAHMNLLSSQFESTSFNKTANATTVLDMTENPAHRLVLLLQVCTHHMSATRDSEMAVIEVGVLSGFKPNEADLKEVINDPEQIAMKYELSTDRSLVVLYMKYIPSSVPYCFQFRLMRDSPVYNLQSGYIRVYEYYSPAHSCSNFYTPSRINNLLETRCEGQACQCASRSLCPATRRLLELGERHQVNATSARAQLTELICSNKYDIVALVNLKSVYNMQAAKIFKLSVKIKSDLKGNLTKIIDKQRQQRALLIDSIRKPQHEDPLAGAVNNTDNGPASSEETSLDYLNLSIDSSCVRDDPLLLHLAHPNQLKQGGKTIILFARSDKLERRYYKTVAKTGAGVTPAGTAARGPRPKPNRFSETSWQQEDSLLPIYDTQDQQYSLTLPLDKDTILHDMTYQAKVAPRESINNLLLWADLNSRREKWECKSTLTNISEQ